MDFTGVPDSTVGATTEVGFTGDLALLNGDAGLKGTGDSSTAASEMAIAASEMAITASEMAIAAFTAAGISVEVPADSMRAAGATAADTGSFPEFLIS